MGKHSYLDDGEITRIVEAYSDMLLRIALNRVESLAQAEDIVQSVYVRLMSARPRFSDTTHERAWLIRTAINLCRDYQKSAYKRTGTTVCAGEAAAAFDPDTGEVFAAVRTLPELDRYAIYLYYYENMPAREIAALLRESEGTTTSRLSRARKKLKKLLEGEGYGTV